VATERADCIRSGPPGPVNGYRRSSSADTGRRTFFMATSWRRFLTPHVEDRHRLRRRGCINVTAKKVNRRGRRGSQRDRFAVNEFLRTADPRNRRGAQTFSEGSKQPRLGKPLTAAAPVRPFPADAGDRRCSSGPFLDRVYSPEESTEPQLCSCTPAVRVTTREHLAVLSRPSRRIPPRRGLPSH